MTTDSLFGTMLREYSPNELLLNEVTKLSWVLKKVKKDMQWGHGVYNIPIESQEASRFEWGSLPASNDIQSAAYIKPTVSAPAEMYGTIRFNSKDLALHNDLKKSFLKILPQKVQQFVMRMEEQINLSMLNDGSLAVLTANGAVGGTVTVGNKIGYFTNGQKVSIINSTPATITGYVNNISIVAGTFRLVTAAGGNTGVDASAMTTALSAKVYTVGAAAERMTSLVDIIFPLSMGGKDSLYGGTLVKANSPVLQPYTVDLSSATTAANFLAALYGFYYDVEELGRGSVKKEVLVPFHAFKAIAIATEGKREYQKADVETTYGSKSILLTGPFGDMKVTGVRGMPADKIMCVDWDGLVLASRGELIQNADHMSDDGFFTERATTGYTHIVDKKFAAELIATNIQAQAGARIASVIS